jgi:hypothetical protein
MFASRASKATSRSQAWSAWMRRRTRDLAVAVGLRRQQPQHLALVARENAVDNFADDLGSEDAAVGGRVKGLGEAYGRVGDLAVEEQT